MRRRAHVVGAGVAGLTSAIALARTGWDVTVHERAPEITEVGAGVQLSPNGLAVLRALDLMDRLRAVSLRSTAVRLLDGLTGNDVLKLDLAQHAPDLSWRFVHRASLIEVLADAAVDVGVGIETDAFVEEDRIDALRRDGIVVGADGLRSVARRRLLGASQPEFTGQVAWRAVIEDTGPPEAQVWMAPYRHLVSYPLMGGLRNIVAVEERAEWTEESWSLEGDADTLRARFEALEEPARDWLNSVEKVHVWGLFLHPPARRWSDDTSLVLAGDAAHPTLPFLAQGANLALEDAWVLAACLRDLPREDAFQTYERLRAPRVRRALRAARRNTLPYHAAMPGFRGALHAALRMGGRLAPAAPLKRFDWLYRHDVTASSPLPGRVVSRNSPAE